MKITFGRLPGIKRYRVPYRYHDQDAERSKDRENRIRMEMGLDIDKSDNSSYTPNIIGKIREQKSNHGSGLFYRSETKKSNVRVLLIVLLLTLIALYVLK